MSASSTKKPLDPEIQSKLEAVVKELFSSNDFHQVNMRGIAQKAGIGLNTIYSQYESKERMLFSFINQWIRQLDDKIAEHLQGLEDIKEKIRKSIWAIFDYYDKNPDIAKIVLLTVPFKTWMTDETFRQKDLSMRIIDLFQTGRNKGLLNANIPAEIMFDIFYGVIHRLVYMSIYLEKKACLTASTNMYCDILWRALENPNLNKPR
jgi:AcrR family transcriptional regulator